MMIFETNIHPTFAPIPGAAPYAPRYSRVYNAFALTQRQLPRFMFVL
jgi:hypothetical protein